MLLIQTFGSIPASLRTERADEFNPLGGLTMRQKIQLLFLGCTVLLSQKTLAQVIDVRYNEYRLPVTIFSHTPVLEGRQVDELDLSGTLPFLREIADRLRSLGVEDRKAICKDHYSTSPSAYFNMKCRAPGVEIDINYTPGMGSEFLISSSTSDFFRSHASRLSLNTLFGMQQSVNQIHPSLLTSATLTFSSSLGFSDAAAGESSVFLTGLLIRSKSKETKFLVRSPQTLGFSELTRYDGEYIRCGPNTSNFESYTWVDTKHFICSARLSPSENTNGLRVIDGLSDSLSVSLPLYSMRKGEEVARQRVSTNYLFWQDQLFLMEVNRLLSPDSNGFTRLNFSGPDVHLMNVGGDRVTLLLTRQNAEEINLALKTAPSYFGVQTSRVPRGIKRVYSNVATCIEDEIGKSSICSLTTYR